jgi:hypothetical protein
VESRTNLWACHQHALLHGSSRRKLALRSTEFAHAD